MLCFVPRGEPKNGVNSWTNRLSKEFYVGIWVKIEESCMASLTEVKQRGIKHFTKASNNKFIEKKIETKDT